MMRVRMTAALIAAIAVVGGSCGDDSTNVMIDVPADATFCSVFTGQYQDALSTAVPITEPGFDESVSTIAAWAEVLRDLAPAEIADLAQANLDLHEAHVRVESAAEFIPQSNEMHSWANTTC